MSKAGKTPLELGKRERQIYETVVALEEASVSDVRAKLANPPSYSAVRATMALLVEKSWLKHRQEGQKYLYRSAAAPAKVRRNAVQKMLSTFFSGSATDAVAALLDVSANDMTDEQLEEMAQMITAARKGKKS